MEFKILKRARKLIQTRIESYFRKNQEFYTCLIFNSNMQRLFRFQNEKFDVKMKFFALFNLFVFQLVTLPMLLFLIFVARKSYKVFCMHMFETMYCIASSIEYIVILVSFKTRTQLLNEFNRIFIKNHMYVKKILTIESVLSTLLTIVLIMTDFAFFYQSVNRASTPEELLLSTKRYPHRRFKSEFLLPFDYSLSPYYEITWVLLIYFGFLLQATLFDVITTMPLISLHIKGQLDIIAFYLRSIGKLFFQPFYYFTELYKQISIDRELTGCVGTSFLLNRFLIELCINF
uniref:Odorant receptor n=1 Tax=Cacopsylla melanoneura TaxID=428564 RepID=A0A8D8TB80_9HEMI